MHPPALNINPSLRRKRKIYIHMRPHRKVRVGVFFDASAGSIDHLNSVSLKLENSPFLFHRAKIMFSLYKYQYIYKLQAVGKIKRSSEIWII